MTITRSKRGPKFGQKRNSKGILIFDHLFLVNTIDFDITSDFNLEEVRDHVCQKKSFLKIYQINI